MPRLAVRVTNEVALVAANSNVRGGSEGLPYQATDSAHVIDTTVTTQGQP